MSIRIIDRRASAHGLNGVSHGFSFMGAQIVEDDNVVGFERRDEELLDIGAKALAVDRTVEHAGRLDAVLRNAARKVAVFHWPCGTLSMRRSPRGAQP